METELSRSGTTASKPSVSPSYKWWVVFMLWFVCFFNYADRQALSGVAPKIQEEFGFAHERMGTVGSAFMWVYAATAPLAGFIGDRFRRKDLILGGCFFWSLVTVAMGWCRQFWQLVTVRALQGLGEAFYFPASMSLLSDYHSGQTRSRAMSFHQSGVYAGTILGSWLGAWFAVRYGWRSGFYIFGGLGMVLAVFLWLFLREPRRGATEVGPAEPAASPSLGVILRDVFHTPTAWILMLVFAGANAVAAVFLFWTPTFLIEKFHFKLTTAGLSGAVFIHLASAFSVPVGGWLADRFSQRWAGGRALVQMLGLGLGASFVMLVGSTAQVGILLAAMTLFGLCKGLYDANIFATVYDVVPARSRASAAGIMNTVGWLGGALATKLTGSYADRGPYGSAVANMSHAITFGGVIYLVGALLLALVVFKLAARDVRRA